MSTMFAGLDTSNMEAAKDSLGGVKKFNSDIYTAKVKVAYVTKAASGAQAINFVLDIDGDEYRETVYITTAEGHPYYTMPKSKDPNKRYPLAGFTLVDDACLITLGKSLAEADFEDKVLSVYDFTQKKQVNKPMPCLVDMMGKELGVAIILAEETVQEKDASGNYVDTDKTAKRNHIMKFFDLASHKTVPEAKAGKEKAEFWDAWLKKNKDQTINRVKKTTTPKPTAGTQAPRKSLFGG